MRLLLLAFLFLGTLSSYGQDSLNVLFRAYDSEGKAVQGSNLSSPGHWILRTDADCWQTIRIKKSEAGVAQLQLQFGLDTLLLQIEVHPSKVEQIQSFILPRLQFGKSIDRFKVNKLSCSWQGSMATALDYQFINPLDGHHLRIIQSSCQSDSFKTEQGKQSNLQVLSDSVMLLKCSKREGIFLKYFLHADGDIEVHPSKKACEGFEEPGQLALFRFFIGDQGTIQLELNGYEALFLRANCLMKMRVE